MTATLVRLGGSISWLFRVVDERAVGVPGDTCRVVEVGCRTGSRVAP
jgi:hypothetical protein